MAVMKESPVRQRSNVDLLLSSCKTVQEIARYLRSDGAAKESRHFYSSVMAHCLVIRGHLQRIRSLRVAECHELILGMLRRLEATVKPSILKAQIYRPETAFPRLWTLSDWWERSVEPDLLLRSIGLEGEYDEPDTLIEFFEKWEDDIKESFPEDAAARDYLSQPPRTTRQPSYVVSNASQSLFQVLLELKKCECRPEHDFGVRLCLGTFRCLPGAATEKDHSCGFDMFLSLKEEWHEADVHFIKANTIKFTTTSNTVPAVRSPKVHAMRAKKLCEPIKKRKPLDRLKLRVDENGQLYKLRSEKCNFEIDVTEAPVSLQQFLEDQNRSLTDKTKRILAVMLAYAVLYLLGTPWLPPTWGPSCIFFFKTTSAAIPLKPFIQTQLPRDANTDLDTVKSKDQGVGVASLDELDPDDFDPDDLDPDDIMVHQCPHVVTLGIMLMELYLATPFEELAGKYGIALSDRTRSIDAELVFRQCKTEIPENSQFHYAVEKCLDPKVWEDENAAPLDDQRLRTKIYQEVVGPLEDELSQAFSYISLTELDSIAETLDLGSWGQPVHSSHMRTSPSTQLDRERPMTPSQLTSVFNTPNHQQQPKEYLDLFYEQLKPSPTRVVPIYESVFQGASISPDRVGVSSYRGMRFFDDETVPEEHSVRARTSYNNWRRGFRDVYDKYITQPPKNRVRIAILDTGVDQTHPFIDAVIEQVKGQYNWTNEKFYRLVDDYNGHGTFTTSLLLEYAPDAEVYVAKISDGKPCSPSIIAKAIDHAVNHWQVDMISMSFGFPSRDMEGYDELESAINRAYAARVLLFAAASNSGANLDRAYPARDENVICIHSTDANGNRSPFSPTALSDTINLATVGESVESAWPLRLCQSPLGLMHKSGTSFATPIAVAIAAFLLQYTRLYLPENAHMLRSQARMKSVLRKISAKTQESRPRDDYHFVTLNCYPDNLFGKDQQYINSTLRELLSQ